MFGNVYLLQLQLTYYNFYLLHIVLINLSLDK